MWEHMAKTHNEMKHHKCSLCSFKTPSRSDLMHHKYAKHGVGRGPTAAQHQTPYHTEGNLIRLFGVGHFKHCAEQKILCQFERYCNHLIAHSAHTE